MIPNKKWNVINTVLIVSSIIIVVSFGIMKSGMLASETVKNNKLSFNSIIDVNNQRIDQWFDRWNLLTNTWWLSSTIDTINLEETKAVSIDIPGVNINNSRLEVMYSTWSNNKYVWLELSKTKNNKLLVNKNIDTRGWFILSDSSSWDQNDLDSNILNQEYLLRNNSLSELSDYISSEINEIGEPWSYVLFNFWFTSLFNRFNFKLTTENKTSFPNIIQLTFDNWVQHNFYIDDTKDIQSLIFPDIRSKYIRLDILSSSDGRVDVENSNIISNIDRNILNSEISITNDTINKIITVSYPAISTINWIVFVNFYSWNNGDISTNSFKSLLKNETSFEYYYSNTPLDTIYIELCSDINACLPKISKTIN